MIFFSNTKLSNPHLTFIGRWTPFHKGHQYIIETKRKAHLDKPILIQVRETETDAYPAKIRAEFIKLWMLENKIEGTIMIIPNVHGVYYGRGVGYEIEQITVPEEIKKVSATNIRKGLAGETETEWSEDLASKTYANLLSAKVSKIIDRGHVIWLTGCPCAGKTTLAKALNTRLKQQLPHLKTQLLDGDVMRDTPLAQDVGFSPEDRAKHIRRMGQLSKMFADHGILVIASFVSPERKIRNEIRDSIGKDRFTQVYVKATKASRMKRDVKGMYAKAKAGEIKNFTGYDAPYEEPTKSEALVCNTNKQSSDQCVDDILSSILTS